jgi:hypothetical protein
MMTSTIELVLLDGSKTTVTYKNVLSQWDEEEIDSVYLNAFSFEDIAGVKESTKKETDRLKLPHIKASLARDYENKCIEILVVSWTRQEPPTPKNIKSMLSSKEWKRLDEALTKVIKKEKMTEEEKKGVEEKVVEESSA